MASRSPNAHDPLGCLIGFDDLRQVQICVNCGEAAADAKLYCVEPCAQEADWVRYARRCRHDGRDKQEDVRQALRIRLALALGRGYDRRERRLTDRIRQLVGSRDHGKCALCGEPGNEIDHISGSSSELANLQLLCDACHNEKTVARFVRITEASNPEIWRRAQWLRQRASATDPIQVCDSDNWASLNKELSRSRRGSTERARTPSLF